MVHKLRPEAERLRELGYSYAMINDKLGISKSTLSSWFSGMPFTPNKQTLQRVKNSAAKSVSIRNGKRLNEINTLKDAGIKEIGILSQRDLWLLGLGLYIGEGAKTMETIRIINSDPAVIKIVIRWLKEVCGLSSDNITIALHIYPDNQPSKCIDFWQKVTGLPRENFRKTQIDMRQNKDVSRRGRLPYGTAHLTVISNGDVMKGVKLYRKIGGWVTGALNQI